MVKYRRVLSFFFIIFFFHWFDFFSFSLVLALVLSFYFGSIPDFICFSIPFVGRYCRYYHRFL